MILIRLFGTWYRSDLPRQLDNLQRALLLITARFSGPTCSLSSFQAPKTSMDSYPRHSVVHLTVKPAVNSTDPIHDWHIIASWYSCCCCCWSLSYSAVLRSRADSLRSRVILHERLAFHSAFLNVHRRGVLTYLINIFILDFELLQPNVSGTGCTYLTATRGLFGLVSRAT